MPHSDIYAENHQLDPEEDYKADWNVWRKRLTQRPKLYVDFRSWMVGFILPGPEGFFIVQLGPISIGWDMWP